MPLCILPDNVDSVGPLKISPFFAFVKSNKILKLLNK